MDKYESGMIPSFYTLLRKLQNIFPKMSKYPSNSFDSLQLMKYEHSSWTLSWPKW